MLKKKTKLLLVTAIVLGGLSGPLTANAETQSQSTEVTVRFAEETGNQGSDDNDGYVPTPINKKGSGFGGLPSTGSKRLPVTGDEYNRTLSSLGWLTLLAVLIFYLLEKIRREKDSVYD